MVRPSSIIAVLICLASAVAVGQQPPPGEMPRERALGLLRAINTAQAQVLVKEKRYVGLPQLAQEGVFTLPELQGVKQSVALAPDGGPIPVGRYALSVEPSATGRRYTVLLTTDVPCAMSWFTNEAGVIYEGKAIGCDAK